MSRDAEYSHTLVSEPYFLNLFGKVKSEDEKNKMLDTFNQKKSCYEAIRVPMVFPKGK